MPQRPIRSLAVVGVLAVGDYLLWNWSLGADHDAVALVSGVMMISLLIVLAWLLVVVAMRMFAFVVRRSRLGGAASVRGEVGASVRARSVVAGARAGDALPRRAYAAAEAAGDALPAPAYAAAGTSDAPPNAGRTPDSGMPATATATTHAPAPSHSSQLAA